MRALRYLAAVSGLVVLAATAHVTIVHTGGYGSQQAVLTLAIAAGVAVGALVIGGEWSGRRALAIWIVAALLCGEAYGLAMTAERLVTAREMAQAPLREQLARIAKARERVLLAEKALASVGDTPRLRAALAAKATADQAAIDKAAERGCAKNCRALLQAQVDAAAAEVEQARKAVEAVRQGQEAELAAARAAFAGMKAPESATPLADRLGIAAWALDLVVAALGSMAANGLAIGLLAFAAHGRHQAAREPEATPEAAASPSVAVSEPPKAGGSVDRFLLACVSKAKGASVSWADLYKRYRQWCGEIEPVAVPLSADNFGKRLAALRAEGVLRARVEGDDVYCLGVRLTA